MPRFRGYGGRSRRGRSRGRGRGRRRGFRRSRPMKMRRSVRPLRIGYRF